MNAQHTQGKHTPGPWRAQPLEGPGHWQIINESCLQLAMARHWPNGQGLNIPECREETDANARLIAAAPELLAALELALATIERLRPSSRGFDSTRGTKDVVCAAIAKVKGGV
jgi:hypothetical protein